MSKEANTEHLRAELKSLADTLEEVLSTSGDKSKEELSKLRSKAEKALQESRYRLGETGDAIARQTREAAARTDEYVRENPWASVGIGAAIGVVLGVLLTRRCLWRIHDPRKDRVTASWVSGSALFPLWLKWWKRGSSWLWSNWKRKKQTFSSCS